MAFDPRPPSVRTLLARGSAAATERAPRGRRGRTPPAPVQRRRRSPRPVIVAFGDSLTAGFGVEPGRVIRIICKGARPERASVSRRQPGVQRRDNHRGGLARVARSGGEAGGGGARVRGQRWAAADCRWRRRAPTSTSSSTEFRRAGPRFCWPGMTLPPNYGPGVHRRVPEDLPGTGSQVQSDADSVPAARSVGGNPDLMQNDGIHPTAEGNRVVGDLVFQFIQKMLK